jgi:hypothetical protein
MNISAKEFISLFKRVSALSSDRKKVVNELLEAFVFKADIQEKLAHKKKTRLLGQAFFVLFICQINEPVWYHLSSQL